MSNSNPNNTAVQIQESRELLIKLLEFEQPFKDIENQKELLENCLRLFDKAEFAFNQIQLTMLIQICTYAMLRAVSIQKIVGSLENELYIAIGRVSLKIIYDEGKDLYRAEAGNTLTNAFEKYEDLYFEDFGQLLEKAAGL